MRALENQSAFSNFIPTFAFTKIKQKKTTAEEIFRDVPAYPTFPGPRGSEYTLVRALFRQRRTRLRRALLSQKITYKGILANPTFPKSQGFKYHRNLMLSRLCSEWEEVGHIKLNHQETTIGNFLCILCSACPPSAGMGRGGERADKTPARLGRTPKQRKKPTRKTTSVNPNIWAGN